MIMIPFGIAWTGGAIAMLADSPAPLLIQVGFPLFGVCFVVLAILEAAEVFQAAAPTKPRHRATTAEPTATEIAEALEKVAVRCNTCDTRLRADARFCHHCGEIAA